MDLLMMWPLLMWIRAVMPGCPHEYSEALSLKERWMLKVTLEVNRDCFHRQANHNNKPEQQSKTYLLNYDVTSDFYICMSSLEFILNWPISAAGKYFL